MPENDLKSILLEIIKRQHETSASLALIFSDLEVLRLALPLLDSKPGAAERLEGAIQMNRDRYAKEIAAKLSELELLRANVSTMVQ